jgi:Flp pilus assembly protein TadG
MTRIVRLGGRRNERGVVIIWIAFFMTVMLGFVAIGIDIAKLMATRTQLQNAADAAALAAASAISPQTGQIDPDTAIARAQETAGRNVAFVNGPEPLQLSAADVVFPTADRVQVTVRRSPSTGGSMVTHMAQVVGVTSLTLEASATALAERSGSVDCGLVPLGVAPPSGQTFQTGCVGYALRRPQVSGTGGRYRALAFPNCDNGPCAGMASTGSSTYQCLFANGYCCSIREGDLVDTQPTLYDAPTSSAVNARFDSDTDQRSGLCHTQYQGNGRRVIVVPVTTRSRAGTRVTVTGFAAFFLQSRPSSGTIQGEFLYAVAPGGGGGNANNTLYSLRLVR